jgi:hypothetical protein
MHGLGFALLMAVILIFLSKEHSHKKATGNPTITGLETMIAVGVFMMLLGGLLFLLTSCFG